jgi:hypothetical protein
MKIRRLLPFRSQALLTLEAWCELLRAAIFVRKNVPDPDWLERALKLPEKKVTEFDPAPFVAAVSRASRFHVKSFYCLERSVALLRMLRRRGAAVSLRIGCRRRDGNLDFHAWVEDAHALPVGSAGDESTYRCLNSA